MVPHLPQFESGEALHISMLSRDPHQGMFGGKMGNWAAEPSSPTGFPGPAMANWT